MAGADFNQLCITSLGPKFKGNKTHYGAGAVPDLLQDDRW